MTGKRVDPFAPTEISEPGRGAVPVAPTVASMAPGPRAEARPPAALPVPAQARPWLLALAVLAGAATAFGLAYALQ